MTTLNASIREKISINKFYKFCNNSLTFCLIGFFPAFPWRSGWLWHVATASLGCDWSHDEAGSSQAAGSTISLKRRMPFSQSHKRTRSMLLKYFQRWASHWELTPKADWMQSRWYTLFSLASKTVLVRTRSDASNPNTLHLETVGIPSFEIQPLLENYLVVQ